MSATKQRKRVAQAKRAEKNQAPIPPGMLRPSQFQLTDQTPYEGPGVLRESTTAADLFALLFNASNGYFLRDNPEHFLANAALCAADDLEMVGYALESEQGNEGILARFIARAEDRLRVAVEVNRRMRLERQVSNDPVSTGPFAGPFASEPEVKS